MKNIDEVSTAVIQMAFCPEKQDKMHNAFCRICPYASMKDCASILHNYAYELLKTELDLQNKSFDLELRVTEILHEIGVPANLKGYRYLREAIMMVAQDPSLIDYVTRELYPRVAEKFDSTASKVERGMRHAIESAWSRGDLDTLKKYFGCTVSLSKDKPTNSEFISLVADNIRMEMKRGENDG